jgi:hypothetical protein
MRATMVFPLADGEGQELMAEEDDNSDPNFSSSHEFGCMRARLCEALVSCLESRNKFIFSCSY